MEARGHLTAAEASAALGIKPETLYAYVSLGLVRSEAAGGRERRYRAEDIAALARRRDPAAAAEAALSFGAPVLDSAITLIADGRLYYRGRDAAVLAREASIREVAALLWQADALAVFAPANVLRLGEDFALARRAAAGLRPVEQALALLPLAAAADGPSLDLTPAAVAMTSARLVRLLAAILAGTEPSARPIDAVLAEAWRVGARARPLLRAALILSADHELNVSAFTARCVASARANPYNAVIAGIAALQGTRHGGESERADAFLAEALVAAEPEATAAAYLRRGERLPGFGHPLYPEGDPRSRLLIDLLEENGGPVVVAARPVAAAVEALIGKRPNLDFALALLRRALDLPYGAALGLFMLGRSLGWLAQAGEQYAENRLIRPRARYIGPPVQAT